MPLAYAARRNGSAAGPSGGGRSPATTTISRTGSSGGAARRRGAGPVSTTSRSHSSRGPDCDRDIDGQKHNHRRRRRSSDDGKNHLAFRVVFAVMLFFMAATLVLLRKISTLRTMEGGGGSLPGRHRRRQDLIDVGRDDDSNRRRNRDVADRSEKMRQKMERRKGQFDGPVVDNRRRYDRSSPSTGGAEADVGDRSEWYLKLREEYDTEILLPESATDERRRLVESLRERWSGNNNDEHAYEPIDGTFDDHSDEHCPTHPPPGYPRQWPLMDILKNWNPDDAGSPPSNGIYKGVCTFDYSKEGDYEKAMNYREAEVPFVLRNHPEILRTVERWTGHPEYLRKLLRNHPHKTEYSQSNHFMYWKTKHLLRGGRNKLPDGWTPPMENIRMTYPEWLKRANTTDEARLAPDREHWYFRMNGCGGDGFVEKGEGERCDTEFLFDEMPYFKPKKSFFIVDPDGHRGINCRFGMRGNIAENHFDGSRNMIALLGGERRYILSHPDQCTNLALYPRDHPSGRHSAVDWSSPDSSLGEYPQFVNATANEVVLRAGDVLYLPEFWFHYIVSLGLNFQCNTRSGRTATYARHITRCGF